MELWQNLVLVGVLVLMNAVFAGSELAVMTLRPGQLRRLREQGRAGRALGGLVDDPSRFLSTVQVGITLGGFLASATAAVSLAEPLVPMFGFFGDAAQGAAIFAVTLVLTYVTLVFGELVPKRIALRHSQGWSMRVARPLAMLSRIGAPAVWVLAHSTELVVRLLGASGASAEQPPTEEELRDIIVHQPGFSEPRRRMLTGALDVAQRSARDVLVPRRDVKFVQADGDVATALAELIEHGHSRAPVAEASGESVVGVVHLRDLVGAQGTVREHARDCLVLPEGMPVLDVLRRLQSARQQMALIANEYGSIEGIVTVEDVMEEIVGEVYDEFDRDLAAGDVRAARVEPSGWTAIPGSFPAHDLVELGVRLTEEDKAADHATVAGLLLAHLERIPDPGDEIVIGGWRYRISKVESHAITEVRLRRA